MVFEKICHRLAARILGKPGTKVECMKPCVIMGGTILSADKTYIVESISKRATGIVIKGYEDGGGWFANRFRKAD